MRSVATVVQKGSRVCRLGMILEGHENETAGDGQSKIKDDVGFRLEQAQKVGLSFELPAQTSDVVRIVRKKEPKLEVENAA